MQIPVEITEQLEREERAYWQIRESLLKNYRGKFVAIVNGQVAAVGDKMGKVSAQAYRRPAAESNLSRW